MTKRLLRALTCGLIALVAVPLLAQQTPPPRQGGAPPAPPAPAATQGAKPRPEDTEVWEPVPQVVTPGAANSAAPSDAIVLFDGKNLDEWVSSTDKSPAKWTVADGVITVNKTGRQHRDEAIVQELSAAHRVAHPGRRSPAPARRAATAACSSRQPAPATRGYELQILDSYKNKTYVNGQAGSIYKQCDSARERHAQARRVADVRRRLDGAARSTPTAPSRRPRTSRRSTTAC